MKALPSVLIILLVFNLILRNTFCVAASPRNNVFNHFFRLDPNSYNTQQSLHARWTSFQHLHPLHARSSVLSTPRRFTRDLSTSRAPVNSLPSYDQNGQSIYGSTNYHVNTACRCGIHQGFLSSNQNTKTKNLRGINSCASTNIVSTNINAPKGAASYTNKKVVPGRLCPSSCLNGVKCTPSTGSSCPTGVKCTPVTGLPLGKGSKKSGCCCCQPCCQSCCCQPCCQSCCSQPCCCQQCCECCECCPCCCQQQQQCCQCCPCQSCQSCCCEPCCHCVECCQPCCQTCCQPCCCQTCCQPCCCCCQQKQPQQCSKCGGKKAADEPSSESDGQDEAIDKLADMLQIELLKNAGDKGKDKKKKNQKG